MLTIQPKVLVVWFDFEFHNWFNPAFINKNGGIMKKLLTVVLGLVAFVGFSISTANAKTLKCQTVISAKADEVKMLKDFGKDVSALNRWFT